ncbi:hypothetical protein Ahy_A09g046576 [Arachis hypogaea]|uniref:Uncharacterized protein n=1 Tax=Arachis hypogaea TaxID=3818 RepID=A0A445BQA3_ARAHY|nr:hypothetical protein Ahy_A09g046576 [Arachis hypogaea]
MRNGDNGVTFECEDPILFRTQRVEMLSDLKILILSKIGGTQARKIGRVAYRLLAPMDNGVFRFRLFRLQGDEHVQLMFDIHGRIMVEQVMELFAEVGHSGVDEVEEGEEESDEDYVADSVDSDSFNGGNEDECVPETPVQTMVRHVLPPPPPIPPLSAVPTHYHSLDLDAMHERISFVLVYPNCRMRNGDNGVTFGCEDPILFRTQRVEMLSDLKILILSKIGGTQARKIGRVAYRLLAPMGNGVFRFRLFRLQGDEHVRLMFDIHGRIMVEQVMELFAEVRHSGGGSFVHSTYEQDDRPLAPPPIHVAIPVDEVEEGEEESDEDYVADSVDSDSFDGGDEDECVPETPVQTMVRHVLPPPHPIPPLSAVPTHYHSLDLDAMHERISFSDTGEEDYNLDGGVEFRVDHKFRSREAVLQGVKNYSIRLCRQTE